MRGAGRDDDWLRRRLKLVQPRLVIPPQQRVGVLVDHPAREETIEIGQRPGDARALLLSLVFVAGRSFHHYFSVLRTED